MLIEKPGFYLTRSGELRFVIGPTKNGHDYDWYAVNSHDIFNSYMSDGSYHRARLESGQDIVRYLPEVTSWGDPIPEPPKPKMKTITLTEWLIKFDGNCYTAWFENKPLSGNSQALGTRTIEVPEVD